MNLEQAIAAIKRNDTALTSIDLYRNNIGAAGAQHLLNAFRENHALLSIVTDVSELKSNINPLLTRNRVDFQRYLTAAEKGDLETIKDLLSKIKISAYGQDGEAFNDNTALHIAAKHKQWAVVDFLSSHYPNLTLMKNKAGERPQLPSQVEHLTTGTFSLFEKWTTPSDTHNDNSHATTNKAVTKTEDFLCPITHEIMFDPVIAQDGFTYEREAIEKHFTIKKTSPETNAPLDSTGLIPNNRVRSMIRTFLDNNPSYGQEVYVSMTLQKTLLNLTATLPINPSQYNEILRQDPRLLTTSLNQQNTTLLEHLCMQGKTMIEAYLPGTLLLLKPKHWQDLMKSQSPQYWLKAVATAYADNLNGTKAFFEALQKGLDITISSLELALFALKQNHLPLFKLAVHILPDVNVVADLNNNTLLHLAAQNGQTPMVEQLAKHGANLKLRNQDNLKPEALARKNNHPQTADTLAVVKMTPVLKRLGFFDALERLERLESRLNTSEYSQGSKPR